MYKRQVDTILISHPQWTDQFQMNEKRGRRLHRNDHATILQHEMCIRDRSPASAERSHVRSLRASFIRLLEDRNYAGSDLIIFGESDRWLRAAPAGGISGRRLRRPSPHGCPPRLRSRFPRAGRKRKTGQITENRVLYTYRNV